MAYQQLDFGPVAEKYDHRRNITFVNLNPLPIFFLRVRTTKPVCDMKQTSFMTSDTQKHNFIQIAPVTIIDIFTGKVKRSFKKEDKLFNKIYDPSEDDKNGIIYFENSDFTIPPNSIVHFEVQLLSPLLKPGMT